MLKRYRQVDLIRRLPGVIVTDNKIHIIREKKEDFDRSNRYHKLKAIWAPARSKDTRRIKDLFTN